MDISAKARGRSINPAKAGIKGRTVERGWATRVDTVDRSEGVSQLGLEKRLEPAVSSTVIVLGAEEWRKAGPVGRLTRRSYIGGAKIDCRI